MPKRSPSERPAALVAHGGEGVVLQEAGGTERVGQLPDDFSHFQGVGQADQQGAEVKFGLLPVEAAEAPGQQRRDDQHGVGIMVRIAKEQARMLGPRRGHGIKEVA